MSDDNATSIDPNANAQAALAPQPAAPASTAVYTAADIEAAAKRAHDAAFAEARRMFKATPPVKEPAAATPQTQATTTTPAATTDVASQIARLRTFDRALGRFDLPDAARDIIEADFNLANPADPSAWIQARSEAYGWKRLGAVTTTPATQPPPAFTPAPQPATPMPGSTPPAAPVLTNDTPLLTIARTDATQVDRLAADIGYAKFKERLLTEFRRNGTRVRVR